MRKRENYVVHVVNATAKEEGDESITLLCNDIQIDLGVTNRTLCIYTQCMIASNQVMK